MPSELPVHSVSFRFSPVRYLRFVSGLDGVKSRHQVSRVHRTREASANRQELVLLVLADCLHYPLCRPV
jgi:hypothetical protein